MAICFAQFAEAACGVVQVMLNGSVEAGAFRSSRYLLSMLPSTFLWDLNAGECVFAIESQCRRNF